jgi:hypothetical protein
MMGLQILAEEAEDLSAMTEPEIEEIANRRIQSATAISA